MAKFKLFALFLICILCVGCGHKKSANYYSQTPEESYTQYQRFRQNYESSMGGRYRGDNSDDSWGWERSYSAPLTVNDSRHTGGVLRRAEGALGTPYVSGGNRPGGFDCSGLVQWAYRGAGVTLPRTAREQSSVGRRVNNMKDMRAGDIVAFRRSGGSGYHTGIYIGNGMFIHAPRTNSRVRVESLQTGYFKQNFIGARRIDMGKGNVAVAEAARAQDMERAQARSDRNSRHERRHETARERSRRDRDDTSARSRRHGRDRDASSSKDRQGKKRGLYEEADRKKSRDAKADSKDRKSRDARSGSRDSKARKDQSKKETGRDKSSGGSGRGSGGRGSAGSSKEKRQIAVIPTGQRKSSSNSGRTSGRTQDKKKK